MLVDIFITYKNRSELFEKSFQSFLEHTNKDLYRLTVVCDGYDIPSFILENSQNLPHGFWLHTSFGFHLQHLSTTQSGYLTANSAM